MKHRLYFAELAFGKGLVKHGVVDVVGDVQVCQVAKLVAITQIIDRNDVGDATLVQTFDDIAANKTSGAGDNDFHADNSW